MHQLIRGSAVSVNFDNYSGRHYRKQALRYLHTTPTCRLPTSAKKDGKSQSTTKTTSITLPRDVTTRRHRDVYYQLVDAISLLSGAV